MALSQEDRISISKKIIDIPKQDAQADLITDQLDDAKVLAEKEDNANKSLMDAETILINLYQSEFSRYDSNGRTELLEQDLQNSAKKVLQNPFFPNDPQTLLPNVPDGVWKNFPAFSGNKAIGKNYNESYTTIQKEQDLIDAINAAISTATSFSQGTQSSGKKCSDTGSCSLIIYDNQIDCLANAGIWTPGPPLFASDTDMVTAMNNLKAAVQAWEDFMNGTFAVIPTAGQDPDATRLTQNNTSRQSITDTIAQVDIWQAKPDFDTGTSLPGTCAAFDALTYSYFSPPFKLNPADLSVITNAISTRTTFISTRIGDLNTNLGSVTQDFNNGEILATAGFYGKRFRFIDMRLNLMGGSLNKLIGIANGQAAQEELKKSNANAGTALGSVLTATAFRAPSTGTSTIHVKDASGFSPGDPAFVVANEQDEIPVVISSIDGNAVFLDVTIPKKYRETEGARLYKEI